MDRYITQLSINKLQEPTWNTCSNEIHYTAVFLHYTRMCDSEEITQIFVEIIGALDKNWILYNVYGNCRSVKYFNQGISTYFAFAIEEFHEHLVLKFWNVVTWEIKAFQIYPNCCQRNSWIWTFKVSELTNTTSHIFQYHTYVEK